MLHNLKSIPITLLLSLTLLSAQPSHKSTSITGYNQVWANFGIGLIASPTFPGAGININFSYLHPSGLYTFRSIRSSILGAIPHNIQKEFQVYQLNETSLLYGKALKRKYGFVSLSGGLGYVWGTRGRNTERQNFSSLGLPLEIQLFLTPLGGFGAGIIISSNLNRVQSFIGTLICIQYGLLR